MLEQADIEPSVKEGPSVRPPSRSSSNARPAHRAGICASGLRLGAATLTITRNRPAEAHQRVDRAKRPPVEGFDLVQGLSGLGAYHLSRQPEHEVTRVVLACVVHLTGPCSIRPDCRRGG
ncbi:hypothetical protein ACFQ0G_14160 [Streptomyces chiangmaiensis]|uniref:Uncharacterized protein n=1 Tax=Streptomyces chiangmaiensis TaxID=766497 RepID=A0ABU7FGP3_9ACTN|nr:hypothetical protein [Streptomyces chiangmaiensis]